MSQVTDVDVNNALPCPMSASLKLRNITTIVVVTVVIISTSPIGLKDITAVVTVMVDPSSVASLLFWSSQSLSYYNHFFLKHRTSFWWLILFFIDSFFIFRLKSVICKKYTNTNGKDSKYTNVIDISIIRYCSMGRGRRHRITRRRRRRRHRPIRRGRGSQLAIFSIFSSTLFMYVSCNFLPRSCLLGFFVTFSDVFSMFILSKKFRKG